MAIVTVNGRRAYYHDGGVAWKAGQPTVAFIHGAGGDHTLWQLQSRALAHQGFNVAVLDLPGHGQSEDVTDIGSVADFAAWVADVLRVAGVTRTALVGHSMGACIAVELAASQPDFVSAVALVGTGMPMKVSAQLLRDTQEDTPQAVRFITAFGHGRPAHLTTAPVPGSWLMGAGAALLARTAGAVLHRDFAVCDAWDGQAGAPRVRCPALVVAGAEDRMTPPRLGKALADALTNAAGGARYVQVPRSGHMVPTEAPRPLLRLLREFLPAAVASAA